MLLELVHLEFVESSLLLPLGHMIIAQYDVSAERRHIVFHYKRILSCEIKLGVGSQIQKTELHYDIHLKVK